MIYFSFPKVTKDPEGEVFCRDIKMKNGFSVGYKNAKNTHDIRRVVTFIHVTYTYM